MNSIDPQVSQQDDELDDGPAVSLMDLLTWLGEGKRTIGLVTLAAVVVALVYALLKAPTFTARTTLLPPAAQQPSASAAALAALGSLGGLAGGIAAKTPDELYVNLLKSDSVQRTLATRFDLYKRYDVDTYEVMRKTMQKYVRVSADKKSGVLTVEVDDEDPKFAAEMANAYASELTKLLGRLAVSEAQQRRVFFDQQLKETKDNLVKAEQALRLVQEKSGMVVLDQQAEAIIKAVAELKTRIIEREVQLKVLRTSTTAQNPDVLRLNSELAALRGELARMESAVPPGAKSASGPGGIDIPIGKLPAAAIEYVRAAREVKFQETMLASMLRQYEVAKLDEAKEGPVLQQVDVAQPPDRKSKPSRALIVLAAALGALLLSSTFVIVRRYRALVREQDPESAQAWERMAAAWRLRRKG
ncbi:MAG TPA: Wzz/FepE/Etk N-terminal domain-containing protein [Rhizobacter sp.]